jgi:predicted secreted acid phosphatase
MTGPAPLRSARRVTMLLAAAILVLAGTGVVVATGNALHIFTPKTADQITNIDILRMEIKNYYGTPDAATGSGATAGWTLPLNRSSNYADEARSVAERGWKWLKEKDDKWSKQAVVFDVDDTTLTTYNYELYSNWDYVPTTNGYFVGLTSGAFTGNAFPRTPGMWQLAWKAHDAGYAVFFITGRGDAQHQATIANLIDDVTAGFSNLTMTTSSGLSAQVHEVDAHYPMPTAIDIGHGGFADGLFTKPPVGSYPAYLDKPQFCGPSIHATIPVSCPTIQYKSGTRAYIQSLGYHIVANFGDQFSDLKGGFAKKTFKMPNPNYYLP